MKPATQRQKESSAYVFVCVCRGGGSPDDLTKLLQRINSILHVDPESQPPQRDGVVGDGQRELCGRAVDLLMTQTHRKKPLKYINVN